MSACLIPDTEANVGPIFLKREVKCSYSLAALLCHFMKSSLRLQHDEPDSLKKGNKIPQKKSLLLYSAVQTHCRTVNCLYKR